MLKLLSKFVLQVLPPAFATVIASVLLSAYHSYFLPNLQSFLPNFRYYVAAPAVQQSAPVDDATSATQRINAEEAALVAAQLEAASLAPKAQEPRTAARTAPPRPRAFAARERSDAAGTRAAMVVAVPPAPASVAPAAPMAAPGIPPTPAKPAPLPPPVVVMPLVSPPDAELAGDPAVVKVDEPRHVLGMPVPNSISAIGDRLNPKPLFHAGEQVIAKIVVAAKSVVPDF